MIKEFHFRFDELPVTAASVAATLGYGDGEIPEPFNSYIDSAFRFAEKTEGICASLRIIDHVELRPDSGEMIVGNIHFNVGEVLLKEYKNSEQIAVFICTAGAGISTLAKELMFGEDPVKGFVYDILGSYIAEATGAKIEEVLRKEFEKTDQKITARYSPGYAQWTVAEQEKLFKLLNGKTCDVQLTESALMNPVKSISGFIGIGTDVKYRKNRCAICNSKDCMYRNGTGKLAGVCKMNKTFNEK